MGRDGGTAMSRLAIAALLLTLVWALTLASFDPADLAVGLLLSIALLLLFRRLLFTEKGPTALPGLVRRIARFPIFALAVLREVAAGTVLVAGVVLGLRRADRPGIVEVPLGERSEAGIAASGLAITLSPGELLIDIDEERGMMLIHVLEAEDPDAVRAHHAEFYRRYQRDVFP